MFLRVAVLWFTEFSMESQTNLHKLNISLCVFTNIKLSVIPFRELKTTVFIIFFTFLLLKLSCKSLTIQTINIIVSFKLWERTDHCQVDPEVPGGGVVEVDATPEDALVTLHDLGDLESGSLVGVWASSQEVAAFALLVGVRPVEGVVKWPPSSVQAVTKEVSDIFKKPNYGITFVDIVKNEDKINICHHSGHNI